MAHRERQVRKAGGEDYSLADERIRSGHFQRESTYFDAKTRELLESAVTRYKSSKLESDRACAIELGQALVQAVIKFLLRKNLISFKDQEDAISDGTIGFIQALERFSPDVGTPFRNFAWKRISGAIMDEVRKNDRNPRLHRKAVREETDETMQQHLARGRAFDVTEVAREKNLPLTEILDRERAKARVRLRYETSFSELRLGRPHAETTESEARKNAPDFIAKDKVHPFPAEGFHSLLRGLRKQERLVLMLYYVAGETFKAIGNRLNITESRASQIHTQAISQLQFSLREPSASLKAPKSSLTVLADGGWRTVNTEQPEAIDSKPPAAQIQNAQKLTAKEHLIREIASTLADGGATLEEAECGYIAVALAQKASPAEIAFRIGRTTRSFFNWRSSLSQWAKQYGRFSVQYERAFQEGCTITEIKLALLQEYSFRFNRDQEKVAETAGITIRTLRNYGRRGLE